MNEFVYLYRRPGPPVTPQQKQDAMEKYRVWFEGLEAKGHLVQYGQPLDPKAGRVVRDKAGSVSDGPYAETKDIVVGFTIVKAKNLDEAVALALTCPIFDQGGMVEVRPIPKL